MIKDKALKERWIEALTSGKYEQGQRQLKRIHYLGQQPIEVKHCCLGVLCDLIPEIARWEKDAPDVIHSLVYEADDIDDAPVDESSSELPDSVRFAIGITQDEMNTLITMNDGYNNEFSPQKANVKEHTFTEIATFIREKL